MRNIRIDDAGHFYLNEYDIGLFVVDYKALGDGKIQVILEGNISEPHKKRVTGKKKGKAVNNDG